MKAITDFYIHICGQISFFSMNGAAKNFLSRTHTAEVFLETHRFMWLLTQACICLHISNIFYIIS